jgi:uncharacterized protein YabE (DUF348 family)
MKNRLISKVLIGVGIVATLVVLYAVEPVLHPAAHAENGRIVTIYHDGQQQVIATDAKTVGEALDRAGVKLDQNDAVEPTASTKLVAQNYDVNVYRARPVIVVDGAQRYRIISPYQSAKKIAESAGLQVYDEDALTISRIDDFVAQGSAGLMLTIKRSTPVHIVLYGKLVDIRTQATTVTELMQEKGVTLGAQDGVSPAVSSAITSGMTIDVYRNGEQTVSEERDVDFTTKQIQDADQPLGYKQVRTPGVKGKKIVTYQLELKNGKEISRKEIQGVTVVESKEQVEVVGAKVNPNNGLSKSKGVVHFTDSKGVVHRETYYDLRMDGVMKACEGTMTVRADGAKVDQNGYVIIAANLSRYPRCSVVETSLGAGKVYDTGSFTAKYPDGFDLATDWSNYDGR